VKRTATERLGGEGNFESKLDKKRILYLMVPTEGMIKKRGEESWEGQGYGKVYFVHLIGLSSKETTQKRKKNIERTTYREVAFQLHQFWDGGRSRGLWRRCNMFFSKRKVHLVLDGRALR